MTYQFRRAVREQCYTLTGFAGPSGSGKTYSALRFAMGLANGGKIAMVDTEARRGLHYADQFDYLYSELASPFTPERYVESIQAAEQAGATVIIVDSMSHEHEGPGGILEMHDTELTRMAGDDFRKRESCKFAAWIKPKAAHNRFVNTILQVKAHLIFCFRAKEKLKLVKNDRGKMEPVQMGWQPICTDRLEYEMTALLMLPPNSKGMPDLSEGATKLQEQHRGNFATGRPIDETMGGELGTWALGAPDSEHPQQTVANGHDPLEEARAVARQGKQAFADWWNGAGKTEASRAAVKPHMDEMVSIAAQADASGQEDEDPFDSEDEATESTTGDPEGGSSEVVAPAPEREGANSAGQPNGTSERLAGLRAALSKQESLDSLDSMLAEGMLIKTVAGLDADERVRWREMVDNHREALDSIA